MADILVFKVGLGDKKSVWQPSPPAEQGRQGTGDLSQQKNFKEKYSKTYVGDGGQKGNYPKPHNLSQLSTEQEMLGRFLTCATDFFYQKESEEGQECLTGNRDPGPSQHHSLIAPSSVSF